MGGHKAFERVRRSRARPPDWPTLSEVERERILANSRISITEVTLEILGWLEVRLDAVKDVAVAKGTDTPVRDFAREDSLIIQVRTWCDGKNIDPQVREVYYVRILQAIIEASSNVQELMRESEVVRVNMLREWLDPEARS